MSSSTTFNLNDFAHEAQSILDAAKKQADEMLASTRAEIEKEKEAKRKEGYAAGFLKGQEEGLLKGSKDGEEKKINEIQKESSFLVKNLASISKEFIDIKVDLLQKAEADLIGLSLAIAEKIVKVKVESVPEIILENIKTAIKFTSAKTNLNIKIHAEDMLVVEKYLPDLKKEFDELENINLIISDDVKSRGGCLISTLSGEVDQSISSQMDKIYQQLLSTKREIDS